MISFRRTMAMLATILSLVPFAHARAQSLGDSLTTDGTTPATIRAGQYLLAKDRTAYGIMQADGNFCIFRGSSPSAASTKVWCTETGGHTGAGYYLRFDNTQVLIVDPRQPLVYGQPQGPFRRLINDYAYVLRLTGGASPRLAAYKGDLQKWASDTRLASDPGPIGGVASPSDSIVIPAEGFARIYQNQYLVAADRSAIAVMQTDGNFCIYRGSSPASTIGVGWCTGTGRQTKSGWQFQPGAHGIAVADSTGNELWKAQGWAWAFGNDLAATKLRLMSNMGRLFIAAFDAQGRTVWASLPQYAPSVMTVSITPLPFAQTGQYVVTSDSSAFASVGSDGNLCIRRGTPSRPDTQVWCSGSGGHAQGTYVLIGSTNGLTIRGGPSDQVVWTAAASGATELRFSSTPTSTSLSLNDASGRSVWSSMSPNVGDRIAFASTTPAVLQSGQYLVSPDHQAYAMVDSMARLCIYHGSGPANNQGVVWCARGASDAKAAGYLTVDSRVGLQVLRKTGDPVYMAASSPPSSGSLRLVNDGDGTYLAIYGTGEAPVWSTLMPMERGWTDRLHVGEYMVQGQYLVSSDKGYYTIMQPDGNLCMYQGSSPAKKGAYVWCMRSTADAAGEHYAYMQDNGDFCVYRGPVDANKGQVGCVPNKNSAKSQTYMALADAGFFRVLSTSGDLFNSAGSAASGGGYPAMTVKNYAPFGWQVWVHYTLNSCDTKWMHVLAARDDGKGHTLPGGIAPGTVPPRNACLLTKVHVERDKGDSIPTSTGDADYISNTGTSYRAFYILGTGDDKNYQVQSEHEASIPDQGTLGKSPGFVITNKTVWPIAVSLDQAGCLYHEVLKPGESMNRTTGAVWFTMTAEIVPDGKDPNNDMTCAIPIVETVASVMVTALTGGVLDWAAMSSFAAAEWGQYAALGVRLMQVANSQLMSAAIPNPAKTAITDALKKALKDHPDNLHVSVAGQYAGPDWPFRCDQKPVYEVTGGLGKTAYSPDKAAYLDLGTPMKIHKTNTCGNSMMFKIP